MTQTPDPKRLTAALPFWMSLTIIPVVALSAYLGGWWLLLTPAYGWIAMTALDRIAGLNLDNKDPDLPQDDLYWYRLITLIWFPIQFVILYGAIIFVSWSDYLGGAEKIGLMAAIGILTGTVGINYAHELMHQKSVLERRLGDALLALVLYSHFRSEHLLVHHRYVATPRDPVTARYNEGFHRFFPRVLIGCVKSSFAAEKAMLARKGLPATDSSNPFWQYLAWQAAALLLALLAGGWAGVGFFVVQAFVAVLQLELVNYVEHYGLTRKHLGAGKYEHVQPRHSWNSAHRMTNYLLINLQRHSDHHYKPNRRFPLLQNYSNADAPQLPYGYPLMTAMAVVPPLWRRFMNPRVRKWRADYYPEITDWKPYAKATNPMPR
jgi:alkane 1-monooxygenase